MVYLKILNIDKILNMKKLILFIFLAFITLAAFTQEEPDSILVKVPVKVIRSKPAETPVKISPDAIVKTNGNMFQCKIIEVNDSLVKYKLSIKDTSGTLLKIPRGEVYAIAYSDGLAMVITPELMGKPAGIYPQNECEALETFKKNLGTGSIYVGVGFVNQYSPIKDTKSFEDTQTLPSVFAGYNFRIKGQLKGGAYLGIGGNELSKSGVSEYDQLKISIKIEENFFCLGLFCRYDILDGMFKPYVKGGLDLIGVSMTSTSTSESLDGKSASLQTIVNQSGIKPGLILRGGLDIYFGNKFGIYSDVGTGLSLVQLGVLFNLE
jgi:hypothetical protein